MTTLCANSMKDAWEYPKKGYCREIRLCTTKQILGDLNAKSVAVYFVVAELPGDTNKHRFCNSLSLPEFISPFYSDSTLDCCMFGNKLLVKH